MSSNRGSLTYHMDTFLTTWGLCPRMKNGANNSFQNSCSKNQVYKQNKLRYRFSTNVSTNLIRNLHAPSEYFHFLLKYFRENISNMHLSKLFLCFPIGRYLCMSPGS